ncbi:unnamed protein product [Cuscuta campestris]|uniref:Uncharacterized protein n=1 Tax=Cuscuta campestris TaxID=132261 RepID=A0A484KR27_9ASTE|nr:unnamed protein product [Cuscuta campestris]
MAYFAYRDKRSGLVRLFRGPVQEPAGSNGFSSRGLVYVHGVTVKAANTSLNCSTVIPTLWMRASASATPIGGCRPPVALFSTGEGLRRLSLHCYGSAPSSSWKVSPEYDPRALNESTNLMDNKSTE